MARLQVGLVLECATPADWEDWLEANHAAAPEAWLRLAKKNTGVTTVTRAEALEASLCYGWIDGQSRTENETYWLQRFTPRTRRSKWSQINCDIVERLIRAGRMQPSGLAAVDAAKADGRWYAAYASPKNMEVPADLADALRQNPAAEAFFRQLGGQNRYAILYRIQDAKKPETRARRIEKFVAMLERGETVH